ncbi:MAG: LEPR-XLL domain-containing protein, partial [Acidobacteria bacterium]|nr:LEPR-XLL domain-containing protein [Acidobacteriota bacterium]
MPQRPSFSLEAFEPRILLSADPLGMAQADLLHHKPLVAEFDKLELAPATAAHVESLGGFDMVIDSAVTDLIAPTSEASHRAGEAAHPKAAASRVDDWIVVESPSRPVEGSAPAFAPIGSPADAAATRIPTANDAEKASTESGQTEARRTLVRLSFFVSRERGTLRSVATETLRPSHFVDSISSRGPPAAGDSLAASARGDRDAKPSSQPAHFSKTPAPSSLAFLATVRYEISRSADKLPESLVLSGNLALPASLAHLDRSARFDAAAGDARSATIAGARRSVAARSSIQPIPTGDTEGFPVPLRGGRDLFFIARVDASAIAAVVITAGQIQRAAGPANPSGNADTLRLASSTTRPSGRRGDGSPRAPPEVSGSAGLESTRAPISTPPVAATSTPTPAIAPTPQSNQTGVIEQETVATLDIAGGILEVEIGGKTPGPGATDPLAGFDQINVTGSATLSGTLKIVLVDGFLPTAGDTFDFLTFGTVTGAFTTSTGLFGFGGGKLYFDVVQMADRLRLTVQEVPGGAIPIHTGSSAADDAIGNVLSEYFPLSATSVTGATLSIPGFVDFAGDIGIEDAGTSLEIVSSNVTATLGSGPFSLGVTSGKLALILNDNGSRVVFASGAFQLSGGGLLNASGAQAQVLQNTTSTSLVGQIVSVGSVSVTIPNAPANTTARISGTSLSFDISGFVTLTGDFGFQKVGTEIRATAGNASATLSAGTAFEAGVSGGSLALLLRDDGTKALKATGSAFLTAGDFAQVTIQSATVKFNSTSTDFAASPLLLDIDGVQATLDVAPNTQSVSLVGLSAEFGGFVNVSGNFGFRKQVTGTVTDIQATGSMVDVSLKAGTAFEAGVNDGAVALLLRSDSTTPGVTTRALKASGGAFLTAGDFAQVTIQSATVKLNDTTTDFASSPLTLDIDGVAATLDVALNSQSVSLVGLSAEFGGFVNVSGSFGFRKQVTGTVTEIQATGSMVDVSLKVGSVFEAGVNDGSIALLLRSDSTTPGVTTRALKATGGAFLTAGEFAQVTIQSATVKLNNTATDFKTNPLTLDIDGVQATLDVAPNTQSVSLVGLNAEFGGFVNVSGNVGFRKQVNGTVTEIQATGSMIDVSLKVGSVFEAGVNDGSIALLLRSDSTTPGVTTKALKATGGAFLTAGDFAQVTIQSATVKLNNTNTNFATNPLLLDIDGVQATLDVAPNTQSVSVVGLNAEFGGFVFVSGNFGFRKQVNGTVTEIQATGSMIDVSLKIGTVFEAGVNDGSIALLLRSDSTTPGVTTKALKATGGAFLTAGDFAQVTIQSATVKLNNTNTNFSTNPLLLDIDGVQATLDVAPNTQSVSVVGLNAEFGGFVNVSGNFGFRKQVTGTVTEIQATGSMIDVSLKVGTVFEAGVNDGSIALLLRSDSTTPGVTTKALKATGGAFLTAGDFAQVTIQSATVKLNNTSRDFKTNPLLLDIDGVQATLDVAPNTQSVSVVGLSAEFGGFVFVSGNFGFRKQVNGTVTEIQATGSMIDVSLKVGTVFEAGVNDGSIALLLRSDSTTPGVTTRALKATGGAFLTAGDFAQVTIQSATVKLNNTATDFKTNPLLLDIDGVQATLDVAPNTQSVSVVGLNAEFGGFVFVSGNFGFRKQVTGTVTEIQAAGSMIDVSLKVGTVFEAGVNDGSIALLLRSDSTTPGVTTKALKAT